MVVHGLDGLCDLSIAGRSRVGRWDGEAMTLEEVDGSVVGVEPAGIEQLFVRSPVESAEMIRAVLSGRRGAARDMVVFNAAAALWVAGLAADWESGAGLAREAIDSGRAQETLSAWVACAGSTESGCEKS
jgi:anthranilate phosphoribosyltransferase